ncbi:MAG: toll/interleukin-1 receptor domain-containing protein [Caulobacterales bacterium]
MADIFLSYSHIDRVRAEPIVRALTDAGYSVFWDQSTPSGDDWNAMIRDALHSARACVVLWSKASVDSRNVIHEATIALDADKLVPAMLEPLAAEDFPMGFYTVQALDLSGLVQTERDMAALVAAVKAKIGAPLAPAIFSKRSAKKERKAHAASVIRPKIGIRPRRNAFDLAITAMAGCLAGYILVAFSGGYSPIDPQLSSLHLDAAIQSAFARF